MKRLKADFHTLTADDPFDSLSRPAETFIKAAACAQYAVLAIACQAITVFSSSLTAFTAPHSVLTVPGIEKGVERKHRLIVNRHAGPLAATSAINDARRMRLETVRT